MGTNGIISLTKDGAVVIKIICGCNGFQAEDVTDKLVQAWDSIYLNSHHPLHDLWSFAYSNGLGCQSCLYVMDAKDILGNEADDPAMERYRMTFDQPAFNPRLESGLGARVVIKEVPSWKD